MRPALISCTLADYRITAAIGERGPACVRGRVVRERLRGLAGAEDTERTRS